MQTNENDSTVRNVFSSLKFPRLLHKPTRSDLFYLILSFLIAFFFWVYIAAKISPDTSVSLSNLKVEVDASGSKAASFGLSVLNYEGSDEEKKPTVSCTIKGSRTTIGGLSSSDVVAYVDFDSTVTDTSGTQVLPIKLRSASGKDYENYTVTPDHIAVTMDYFRSMDIPVSKVLHPNLKLDNEVVIYEDEITADPATVTVYGPSTQLSNVHHIQLTIDDAETLSATKTFTNCTNYELVDANGNAVSDSAFHVQVGSFSATVPVHYTKTLPVTIEVSCPKGFDPDNILRRIRLKTASGTYNLPGYGDNPLTITIETNNATKKAQLNQMEAWSLLNDKLPLHSFSTGMSKEVSVAMIDGYEDVSHLEKVYITLDSTDLIAITKPIKNSDISILRGPANYTYTLQSPAGNTIITLIGTKEELAKIDASDLRASFNPLTMTENLEGTTLPVTRSPVFTVTLPESVSGVWVSGEPKVNIIVSSAG